MVKMAAAAIVNGTSISSTAHPPAGLSSSNDSISSSNNGNNANNGTAVTTTDLEIRIVKEQESSFMCGVSSVSNMSAEYTFSSAFRFGSKVWKLGTKRLKEVYSFLIYPMDVEEKSQEQGYCVQMTIISKDEIIDHIFVDGRREFHNNATIFVWTASFTSLKPFLVEDSLFMMFRMKILLPEEAIFSLDVDREFRRLLIKSPDETVSKTSKTFPIILTGIQNISLNGISSPPFTFEGNVWELKMCQNGNLYAFRIMCNRKVNSRFSIFAKIQLSVRSPQVLTDSTGFRTIHVEGCRRFCDSDDSMFWSFDKRLDRYVSEDALNVEMVITVFTAVQQPKDEIEGPQQPMPASQQSEADASEPMQTDETPTPVTQPQADHQQQQSSAAPSAAETEQAVVPAVAPAIEDVHIPPDITLLVGRDEVPITAHRQLLISHSPYIATLCKKVRGLSRARIADVDVPEVMSLLKLIYLGRLEIEERNIVAHLKAAKLFQMKEYFTACSNMITVHNVLLFVNMTTDETVLQQIWNIIDENSVQVLQSPLFLEIPAAAVIEVIQRDELRASEMQIYEACVKWAEAEIRRQKSGIVTGKTIRKVLERIIHHVRFPLMDPVALALITDEKSRQYYKVLDDKEALGVFRAIHSKDQSCTPFSLKPRIHTYGTGSDADMATATGLQSSLIACRNGGGGGDPATPNQSS